jgi:lysozyme
MSKITEQLKRDEGFKLTAYQDHLGYWTIGVGRLIDIRKGGGITAEEAEYLLANDIQRRTKDLSISLPRFDELDEARKGVLVNMAFQLGTNGLLNFKKTLESVRRGHYVAAANEMLQSKWADQTPMRAERLAKQMMTGVWQ